MDDTPKAPLTPLQKAQRKYELIHKDERKERTGQFNTRIPRQDFDEICNFLNEHHIPKTVVIYRGYQTLKSEIESYSLPEPIQFWGLQRLRFICQYKPKYYSQLLMSGQLWHHLSEVEEKAEKMKDSIIQECLKQNHISDSLKQTNPTKWATLYTCYSTYADSCILVELIYV